MPAQLTARSSFPNFSLARDTADWTSASDVTWKKHGLLSANDLNQPCKCSKSSRAVHQHHKAHASSSSSAGWWVSATYGAQRTLHLRVPVQRWCGLSSVHAAPSTFSVLRPWRKEKASDGSCHTRNSWILGYCVTFALGRRRWRWLGGLGGLRVLR